VSRSDAFGRIFKRSVSPNSHPPGRVMTGIASQNVMQTSCMTRSCLPDCLRVRCVYPRDTHGGERESGIGEREEGSGKEDRRGAGAQSEHG